MNEFFSPSPSPTLRERLTEAVPAALARFPPLSVFMQHSINYTYMCFSICMQHMPDPYGCPRAKVVSQSRVINT